MITSVKTAGLMAVLVLCAGILQAQTGRLEVFQRNFAAANVQTKIEVLRGAEREDAQAFGPLYEQALRYVLSNSRELYSSPLLRDIARTSIDRLDAGQYRPALGDLWRLFQVFDETSTRIRVLEVISGMGADDERVLEGLVDWVRRQHIVSQGGGRPDLQVLAGAVRALGDLQAAQGFGVLVDTVLLQYPDFVTTPARQALGKIDGAVADLALAAVRNRPLAERRPAFSFLLESGLLSEEERLELARTVLSDAEAAGTGDIHAQEEYRQIRFAAAAVLRAGEYSQATPEVIRHFNQTVLEFERGRISSGPLLEAIATLGAMGNDEAARRLTTYLELVNTYTETDRPYDTQIVLAVIGNLEALGNPLAFDAMFYTTLLENYPSRIRQRAREALRSVAP
ncbi:hypothetical protein [Alkalispirochaeta sphaeroplastigenens]|uniref:hypothetical protein n=1 Tax=Alkalispirochaeta sphaeroplastigenens TaxID=1187066 RepID=UPI0011AF79AD|nr:hypothetical protein [Alkalispirochaeta sphaeroplastigenens]